LIAIAHLAKGDFVVIPAASSSVGIAATQMRKLRALFHRTTRKSNKKLNCFLWVRTRDRH